MMSEGPGLYKDMAFVALSAKSLFVASLFQFSTLYVLSDNIDYHFFHSTYHSLSGNFIVSANRVPFHSKYTLSLSI